jgi:hypothetical protein
MMNDRQENLDQRLASLPKDVMPAKNLWPGIVERVDAAQRRRPPMALAASITLVAVGVAGLFAWAVLHSRSVPDAPQTAMAAAAFAEPTDPKYVQARAAMEQAFRDRLPLLAPVTRAKIEASLAVIRQAHEDIRNALSRDPGSPVLQQLWESTWHDEFDLYDHVVQATQPTFARI